MNLRILMCVVLISSLAGLAHGGDRYSRGWGHTEYRQDRHADERVVILYQRGQVDSRHDRYPQRYDQHHGSVYEQRSERWSDPRDGAHRRDSHSSYHDLYRDNRDHRQREHFGYRDQRRGWDQQYRGDVHYRVPQQRYHRQRHDERGGVRLYFR